MKASNILKSGALLGAGYFAGRRSKGGPLIGGIGATRKRPAAREVYKKFGDIVIASSSKTPFGRKIEYMQDKGDYLEIINPNSKKARAAFKKFHNWKIKNNIS